MNKVDIKERLKQCLEIRGITQSQLAIRANIDKGQLSSYISGKYKPRQNNIDALAKALNVSEAWLMGCPDGAATRSSSRPCSSPRRSAAAE